MKDNWNNLLAFLKEDANKHNQKKENDRKSKADAKANPPLYPALYPKHRIPFGKYKGHKLSTVWNRDKAYCEWFKTIYKGKVFFVQPAKPRK